MLAEKLDSDYLALPHVKVAKPLYDFVNTDVLPGLNLSVDDYWPIFDSIIAEHYAENMALLRKRDQIQQQIDDWHHQQQYDADDLQSYKQFLTDIDYLLEDGADIKVE